MVLNMYNLLWVNIPELIKCVINFKFNRLCNNLMCSHLINLDHPSVLFQPSNMSSMLFQSLHPVLFSNLGLLHLKLCLRLLLLQYLFNLPHLFLEYLQLLFLLSLKYQSKFHKSLYCNQDLQSRLQSRCLQDKLVQVWLQQVNQNSLINCTRDNINLDLWYNTQHISINHTLDILLNHLNNPSLVRLILVIREVLPFLMQIQFHDILDILLWHY